MVYHEILTSSRHICTSASECVYGVELVKIEWYTIPGGVILLLYYTCVLRYGLKHFKMSFSLATSCLCYITVLYHEYMHSHVLPLNQSDHWICTINTQV